mmetsp:Transcript_42381/g.113372  ORF Transcript_42381/g.113372 Transcript_42381/m.113372 type:complete len:202 (+) Transcript_42381:416-1021(+)
MLGRRGILVHSWKQARPSLPHRPGLASHPFQPVLAQLRHHFANLGTLQILEEVGLVRCARRQPPPQQSLQLPHLRVCSLCSSGHCSSQTLSQLAQALSQTPLVCFLSSAPGAAGCSRLHAPLMSEIQSQQHGGSASASAASWYSRSSRIRSGVPCAAFHKACSLSSSCLSDRPFSPATSLGLWMSQKRKKADLTVLPPLSD